MNLTFRPETTEDEAFIRTLMLQVLTRSLGAEAWPEPLRTNLLDTQYRVRREGFRQMAGDAPGTILCVDGEPAGWLVLAETEEAILIVNIAVLEAWQGRGLGTWMLRSVIEKAGQRHIPVQLEVARINDAARRLYLRLGFHEVGGNEIHHQMEWKPQSAAAGAE